MVIKLSGMHGNTCVAERKETNNRQQTLWLVLIAAAFILRDIGRVYVPDILFTALCGMAFLLLPTGSAMGVYMFTSALSVPDFEIRLVYAAVLLVKFFIYKRKFSAPMLLIMIAMVFLEVLGMMRFSTSSIVKVLYDVGMYITYFALPIFWYSEDYSKEDYKNALICYVAGVVLGGSVLLYMSVNALGWDALIRKASVRLGLRTTNGYETQSQIRTGYNANQLGIMFAIVITVVFAFIDQKRMSKFLGFLLVPYSLFIILLTKSRTAILMALGAVAVYYFVLLFRRKKAFIGIVFLGTVVALIYGMTIWMPEVTDGLLKRFQDSDNLTGGRDVLFTKYMQAWVDNVWAFLFGYGIGAYRKVVDISNVPHNILADIVISWGLIGVLLIGWSLLLLYRKGLATISKGNRLLAYLPALVAFVSVLGGQYLSTGYPHMRLCFLLLAAKALADEKQATDTST